MAKTNPEKRLQKDIQYSIGCAFPGNHYIRVTHPDVYEEAGKPDLIGHIFGMHVEIELKVDGNRPSPSQVEQIRRVNSTGGFACIILHHRRDDAYYLISGDNVDNFSYRKRKEKWLLLTHAVKGVKGDRRVVINMNGIHIEIVNRLKERFK